MCRIFPFVLLRLWVYNAENCSGGSSNIYKTKGKSEIPQFSLLVILGHPSHHPHSPPPLPFSSSLSSSGTVVTFLILLHYRAGERAISNGKALLSSASTNLPKLYSSTNSTAAVDDRQHHPRPHCQWQS